MGKNNKKIPKRGKIITFEEPAKTKLSKAEIDLSNPVAKYEKEQQDLNGL